MNRILHRQPDQAVERRGAAVVEFALVAPLFFMLVLGVIEFGQAFMVSQLINSAAREGARLAITDGSTNADVETVVTDVIQRSTTTDPNNVTVAVSVTEAAGNPSAANEVSNASKRDLCTVNVTVPYADVALITGSFLQSVTLRGNCSMRHE